MRNEKGVTLIELLVVLALAAVVIGVGSMAYFSLNRTFHDTSQYSEDQTKERLAMDLLTRYITDASAGSNNVSIVTDADLRIKTLNYRTLQIIYETVNGKNQLNFYTLQADGNLNDLSNKQLSYSIDDLADRGGNYVFRFTDGGQGQIDIRLPFNNYRTDVRGNKIWTSEVVRQTKINLLKY